MRYIFTFLFLLPSFSFAEDGKDLSYLKKLSDPDKLMVMISVDDDCRTSQKGLDKLVKGAMIRSRIKPTDEYTEPLLNVQLRCLELSNNNPVYEITTRFGYYNYDMKTSVFFAKQYGFFGIGNKQSAETAVKDSIDRAMTDYIQANFMDD